MAEAIGRNARIRIEGTKNLVAAALVAGTGRMIAQSIAWAYAPGARPYSENDGLDLDAEGTRAISVRGVATLERLITTSQPLEGCNYTVPEPGMLNPPDRRRYTSMPRRRRRCSRSNEEQRAFSTLLKTKGLCRLKRPGENSAGIPAFASQPRSSRKHLKGKINRSERIAVKLASGH